jgi:drug/metabolite transporter (DMT)-like permease
VGAALSYAAYIMAVRRARNGADAGRISLISSAICAVFCLVAALALGEAILPSSLQGWLAVIALGLVSHALGQGLITLSLGQYGASAARSSWSGQRWSRCSPPGRFSANSPRRRRPSAASRSSRRC